MRDGTVVARCGVRGRLRFVAALCAAAVPHAGCHTLRGIEPSQLVKLDGFVANQGPPARQVLLRDVHGDLLPFDGSKALELQLVDGREAGGRVAQVAVRGQDLTIEWQNHRRLEIPLGRVDAASVKQLDPGLTAVGVVVPVAVAVAVGALLGFFVTSWGGRSP